jgi:glycosyltransferase involved in cell wall biosynthesis
MQMCQTFANFQFPRLPKPGTGGQAISNFQLNSKSQISKSKIEVELVIPKRFNKIKKDPFEYYGMERVFKVTKLPCLDLIPLGLARIGFLIQTFTFLILARIYLLFKKYDLLYTREPLAGLFFRDFVLELHYLPKGIKPIHKKIWQRVKKIIVLTNFIKDKLVESGILPAKILVAPDGVALERFNVKESQIECRQKLNLPLDKKIVLYTGHLYEWKGAAVLLAAARNFQFLISNFQNVLFVFVGGTEEDIEKFKKGASGLNNVLVVGHRPYTEIPYWLKAADVLILPNSAREKISQFYTSPLKLFEYLAAGKPIVASDLPSIREILNENNSILVKPDNPESLAKGINLALQKPDFSVKIAKQARQEVKEYSWQKRAQKILNFLKI